MSSLKPKWPHGFLPCVAKAHFLEEALPTFEQPGSNENFNRFLPSSGIHSLCSPHNNSRAATHSDRHYTHFPPVALTQSLRTMAEHQQQQQQQQEDEPQATHFVVHYEPGLYAIFPAFVLNEEKFWLQHRWEDCTHCLQHMVAEEAEAGEANNGQGGGIGGGGGGGGPNAQCQCLIGCAHHLGGQLCPSVRQNGTVFCNCCQVPNGMGCPGIPGQPPCQRGRQAKTAINRWSCNQCAHYLGLLMRIEITKALVRLGLEGEVVRLFAQVDAPADVDPMEFTVEARFANAFAGCMRTQDQMANHASPVVFNTWIWAIGLMENVLPPDAPSCIKIRVVEEGGGVVGVQLLGGQMGVNGMVVDVVQDEDEEAAEQP